MNGTSMACPQVSGMAAILGSAAPEASIEDIRGVILKTADPIPSLANVTSTGGRANLTAALIRITGGSPHHLRLHPGWNHISIPFCLNKGDDTAEIVFNGVKNISGHSIYQYDSGQWRTVLRDNIILPFYSYWIYTNSEKSLPLFVDPNQSEFISRHLTTGWNGFGIVGMEETPALEILKPLSDIWTYVIGFNSTMQQYDEPIVKGGTGTQNDSRLLHPYQGYWIFMIRNGTLVKSKTSTPVVNETVKPLWPQKLK
jgi:hypothetical protein